ncbi:hypothetical protein DMC30DRAFT_447855, partial [Rhodotorula diobovata]
MSLLPPGPEILVPNERALAALANPLREGGPLHPAGPPLRLEVVSPTGAPSARIASEKAFESPNALRPSCRDLLDAARTAHGWRSIQFRLVEGLHVGHGKYAQVWTAETQVGGRAVGRVVLKLFADAQWPLPHDYRDTWRPVGRRVSSELQAYAARRPTQGRDVAYCYGAYSFEMPWGDVVTGVVLEDLSRTAESIADFCKREKRNLSSVEDAYNVLSSSFRHLHRLHSLDVGHVQPRLDNILVLR